MAQNQNGINGFLGNPASLAAQFPQLCLPLSLHQQFHQQSAQHVVQQQRIPPMEPFYYLSRPIFENAVQIPQQFSHQLAEPTPLQSPVKPVQKHGDDIDSNSSFDLKFLDEVFHPESMRTSVKLDPKTRSLCNLQRISIQGCESAARIFSAHSKRPYFKKIDVLCNRLQQDLSNTNKAVININSHGVAWAIKDFVFVFNRIISAWVIMRDYFYSNSDGMQCVKESIDKDFAQNFFIWQEATSKLAKSLVNSFENLHNRDQRNGNRKNTKPDSNTSSPANGSKNDPFHRIFDPLIAENSEQMQLSGNYLKSAVYKPLSSSEESTPPNTPASNPDHSYESFVLLLNDIVPENVQRSENPKPLYKRGTPVRSKVSLEEKFNLDMKDSEGGKNHEDPISMVFCYDVLKEFYGIDGAKKIVGLFNEIVSMRESLSFMDRKEGAKVADIPNYISCDDGPSITQIISSIQEGKFPTVCDVFIAVKMMAEYAKALLQFNQGNNDEMKIIVMKFVKGVEGALARFA